MAWRFLAHCQDNVPVSGRTACVAEYNTGALDNDHSGLIAPKSNLSKVNFHSDLDYLRQMRIVKSTDAGMSAVVLAATPYNATVNGAVQLFAHGLGYAPLLNGTIVTGGYAQPCCGSTMPIPGGDVTAMGYRWIDFTADATYVYMFVRGWYSPAMTIDWTVRILGEQFQTRSDTDDLIRFDPVSADIIGFGKIDDAHRFLRRSPSGPGQFRVIGAQTMSLSMPSSSARQINFSDGSINTARLARGGNGAHPVTGALAASGEECVVSGGTCARGAGFHWDQTTGPILAAASNDVIWTVQQASMVSLANISASITTAQHDPTDSITTGLHVTDHDLGAVPAGTERLEGWGMMTSAGGLLPVSYPFPMSGTVMMVASAVPVSTSIIEFVAWQSFSPIISGGHAWLREEWFNYSSNPAYLASVQFATDMRAIAFVGGNG